MGCESVCGNDWAWVWDLLSSGLLGLLLMGGAALWIKKKKKKGTPYGFEQNDGKLCEV